MTDAHATQYRPSDVSPPGATIAELIEVKGIRQNELAIRMNVSPKFVNELIAGKVSITPPTAIALERALAVPADFWLRRDARYQEYRVRNSESASFASQVAWLDELPLQEMRQFGWIKGQNSKPSYVAECLAFFGVANPDAWKAQYVDQTIAAAAFRKSNAVTSKQGHVAAWLREGERIGMARDCDHFDRSSFITAVKKARSLTLVREPKQFVPSLESIFAKCGVVVAVVRAPRNCPISGAVRWLSPSKALVQLSFKYLRNDSFWFTFFHECGHIALHSKKMLFLESEGRLATAEEHEANQFAADTLIPNEEWRAFLQSAYTFAAISGFAKKLDIAPAIVLGRLQNEKLVPWKTPLNSLRVMYQWSMDPET
jgi:plasmid maintenance system antidote protein VapI